MYLITIEGGDGSGKGLAATVVSEVLAKERGFNSVELTAEPRRRHPLGRAAINAVREKKHPPQHEAKLFALDRLDHGLNWILPRLQEGSVVICDRNIHSSMVYQGVVGGIGIRNVASLNAGALVPDLCIWVDCDPEIAIRRIKSGSLREASPDKAEYFETLEIQRMIRSGYSEVLSGNSPTDTPFDEVEIIGPILNDTSVDEFSSRVKNELRRFLRSRPKPKNVDINDVDLTSIERIIGWNSGQAKLPGFEMSSKSTNQIIPWHAIRDAERKHSGSIHEDADESLPRSIHSRSIYSVMGAISLLSASDLNEMLSAMGPTRLISRRHANRVIAHLSDSGFWVRESFGARGEGSHYRVTREGMALGKLMLVLWPIRSNIRLWRSRNPRTSYKHALSGIIKMGLSEGEFHDLIDRIRSILPASNMPQGPNYEEFLLNWWDSQISIVS